ncbi:hypothetical protein ABTY98_37815 [Streptomyces sp. NPDC096040]|uniref:hypothetical protein n=1 Tax=Streptomyces sp. NPDC096040 TaxID=3155541 RepID=UPI0033307F63
MSIVQQYFLDTYRARQHGDPGPPAPGAHDVRGARTGADRPSTGVVGAVRRLLRARRGRPRPCGGASDR